MKDASSTIINSSNVIGFTGDENTNNANKVFVMRDLNIDDTMSMKSSDTPKKKKKSSKEDRKEKKKSRRSSLPKSIRASSTSSTSMASRHSRSSRSRHSLGGSIGSGRSSLSTGKSFLHVLVERLLPQEESKSAVETLLSMKLYQEEHLEAREEVSSLPVCEFLMQAMKCAQAHSPLDDEMQYKCCGVIEALTCQHNENKLAFHQAGAPSLIVKAMRMFPESEKMQRYGCGALCNLASLHSHQEYVMEAGGVTAILDAMKDFPDHEDIQKFCCYTICHLVWFNDNNRKLIISKGGGLDLAESQHRFFGRGSPVEDAAAQALRKLHA